MRSQIPIWCVPGLLLVLFSLCLACGANTGADGADGSAGEDGEGGVPGPAGQDGGDGSGSAPQSPSSLTAEAQSPSQIDVRWVFNTGTELGFNIQRSESEGEWETVAGTAANVTVYRDETVECENTYTYRVLAYNDYGESSPSNEESATADFCQLDTPSDLTAILDEDIGDGSQRAILLSWSEGAGELPGVPMSYEIYRKTFDASWSDTPLATQPSDQTTYTDEDAACDGTYQYRVRAANENDVKSAFSNTATNRSDACPLVDPSNLVATTDLAGSIEITWDINDPDATGYLLQRREHEARDEWTTIVDLPEGSTSYSDDGAPCETAEYDYRLRAYNGDKHSAWVETLTPGSSYCPVDAPSGLYANVLGPNEIELSWINNADNATGIRIYRDEAELTTLSPDSTSYNDATVDCQTLYRYTVTAYTTNVESDFTNAEAAQSGWCPISAPYNVTTVGDGNEVTVSWEHDQQYVESFDVQRRSESEGTWQLLDTVAAPDLNLIDGTVQCYKTYEYRVLAYNEHVESDWSEMVTGAATGCTPERPRPVLSNTTPESYIAYSHDAQDPYTLVATGEGIADAVDLVVGDYIIPCDTAGQGTDCEADENGDPVAGTCATECSATLPDELMAYADTYVVRLKNPDPVFGGQNESAEFTYLNVVAPLPEVTKIWPRSVMQLVNENFAPIPSEFYVEIWGKRIMANAQFRLSSNFGEVSAEGIQTDPNTKEQYARVLFSTQGLNPRVETYDFAVINPSPGGGERNTMFGIKPRIEDWTFETVYPINSFSATSRTPMTFQRFSIPKIDVQNGLGWNGAGEYAASRDRFGRLLTRFSTATAPGAFAAPINAVWADVQNQSGKGAVTGLFDTPAVVRGGEGTFSVNVDWDMDGPGGAHDTIRLADINGDGAPDMITARMNKGKLCFRLGEGDGSFSERTDIYMPDIAPRSVAIADVNSDGALDLVTANQWTDDASIVLGEGDGTFGDISSWRMGDGPVSADAVDLNGDGVLDLVIANQAGDDVSIRLGAGNEAYGDRFNWPMGDTPMYLSTADLNGDGVSDLVTANYGSNDISIRLGDGNGAFGDKTDWPMGVQPSSVEAADLNGDGVLDLFTANRDDHDVSIRLGNGDGTFGDKTDLPVGTYPEYATAAELNSDGILDLVVANHGGDDISIFLGFGDGSFGSQSDYSVGDAPTSVAVADLNGDGVPDVATANEWSGDVSVRLGNAGDSFDQTTFLGMVSGPVSIAVANLNEDDNPDLVSANPGSNYVAVFLGTGDGAYGAYTTFSMGTWPMCVVAADLNEDNIPDLATANRDSNNVSVRFGDGSGGFGSNTDLDMGTEPYSVTTADVNGDKIPDLMSANFGSDNVSIRLGDGFGGLDPNYEVDMGDGPHSVLTAHLNGDDALDLVTANHESDNVSVRLGDGAGGFGPITNLEMGDGPNSVAMADLNGDDALDLVVTKDVYSLTVGYVSIRYGDGNGGFGELTEILMTDGCSLNSIVATDIDGDGNVDLATGCTNNGYVSIRLGEGGGNFSQVVNISVSMFTSSIAAGDLDNDGITDLIAAVGMANHLTTILLGDIPGTWHQELTDSFSDDPDQPWLPKYAESGFTEIDIHQATQTVTKVGVRVFLEWATQPVGSVDLGLTAPDGQMVDLGSHSDFAPWPDAVSPTSWRINKTFREYDFNGETGIAGLIDLHGLQPTDYWTLSIENQTGASAEVKNFTVITDGHF